MTFHPIYYLTASEDSLKLQPFFSSDISTDALMSWLTSYHAYIPNLLQRVDAHEEPLYTQAVNTWLIHASYMKAKHRLLAFAQRNPQRIRVQRLLLMFPQIYRHVEPLEHSQFVDVSTLSSEGDYAPFVNIVEGDEICKRSLG